MNRIVTVGFLIAAALLLFSECAIKGSKPTNFDGETLTLTFKNKTRANYFSHRYQNEFEKSASSIAGKKISAKVEIEE